MRLDRVVVHKDLRVCAIIAVVVRRKRQVVARMEVFGEDPRQVRLRQRDVTGFFQCRCCGGLEFFPCFRRLDTRCGQRVHVVIHDRRGRVERHADHLAIAVGIEIANACDVILDVEINAIVGQQILHRNSRAFRADHGCGARVKHLHDVRLFASAECGDACGQRFFIGALKDRGDCVVILRCVELFSDLVDGFAKRATHGVPPCDFGFRKCSICRHHQRSN